MALQRRRQPTAIAADWRGGRISISDDCTARDMILCVWSAAREYSVTPLDRNANATRCHDLFDIVAIGWKGTTHPAIRVPAFSITGEERTKTRSILAEHRYSPRTGRHVSFGAGSNRLPLLGRFRTFSAGEGIPGCLRMFAATRLSTGHGSPFDRALFEAKKKTVNSQARIFWAPFCERPVKNLQHDHSRRNPAELSYVVASSLAPDVLCHHELTRRRAPTVVRKARSSPVVNGCDCRCGEKYFGETWTIF